LIKKENYGSQWGETLTKADIAINSVIERAEIQKRNINKIHSEKGVHWRL
jgi:hypothetical protein